MSAVEMKLELFPTVTLRSADSAITVPCEIIAPGVVITPRLSLDPDADDTYLLGGGFNITHSPSGYGFVGGQACIECARKAARMLAATGVDWLAVDPSTTDTLKATIREHYQAVIAALRLFDECEQQVCYDEPCDACGGHRQHAEHCIYVVERG